jgi:hypothetical protein
MGGALLFGILLSASLLFISGGARAADLPKAPPASIAARAQFAFADFDGDRIPDSAILESDAGFAGKTNYSIQLGLSAGGRKAIRLIAPAGGLLIEARDVNGDNTLDLVLSTAWSREPVAVFLNDGHGDFSRADPGEFPHALSESNSNHLSTVLPRADVSAIAQQSGIDACLSENETRGQCCVEWVSTPEKISAFNISRFAHLGRAPPFYLS